MIGLSILVYLSGLDGHLGRLEGGLMFVGLLAYTAFSIRQSRRESAEIQKEYVDTKIAASSAAMAVRARARARIAAGRASPRTTTGTKAAAGR